MDLAIAAEIPFLALPELEEVQQPRTAWGFTGTGETIASGDRVNGARLAGIRPPSERDLRTLIHGKLGWRRGAQHEVGVRISTHGNGLGAVSR